MSDQKMREPERGARKRALELATTISGATFSGSAEECLKQMAQMIFARTSQLEREAWERGRQGVDNAIRDWLSTCAEESDIAPVIVIRNLIRALAYPGDAPPKLSFREWLCSGGGGHEDGEDGIRACTLPLNSAIAMVDEYLEYLRDAPPKGGTDK